MTGGIHPPSAARLLAGIGAPAQETAPQPLVCNVLDPVAEPATATYTQPVLVPYPDPPPKTARRRARIAARAWWRRPRYRRRHEADLATDLDTARHTDHLRRALRRLSPETADGLRLACWAASSWAARRWTADDASIRLTARYVALGADVGLHAAGVALTELEAATGGHRHGGRIDLSARAIEACWRIRDEEIAADRMPVPLAGTELDAEDGPTAFSTPAPRIDCERGKTSCGCDAHAHGDRDPSLLYDRRTGRLTCLVRRTTWALVESDDRATWEAREIRLRARSGGAGHGPTPVLPTNNYTPTGTRSPGGSPGHAPRSPGVVNGRLDAYGNHVARSSAASRGRWAAWNAARYGGPAEEREVWHAISQSMRAGRHPREWRADRLYGVGWWRVTSTVWTDGRRCWTSLADAVTGSGGVRVWPVSTVEEGGTGHVLLDLDDTDPLPTDAPAGLVDRLRAAVERVGMLGDVETVVRTSGHGLQVLVRLREFRWNVDGFYRDPRTREELRAVGAKLAAIVGGHADESAWAPGRFGRAPGWRHRGGLPEMAALWYAADARSVTTTRKAPMKLGYIERADKLYPLLTAMPEIVEVDHVRNELVVRMLGDARLIVMLASGEVRAMNGDGADWLEDLRARVERAAIEACRPPPAPPVVPIRVSTTGDRDALAVDLEATLRGLPGIVDARRWQDGAIDRLLVYVEGYVTRGGNLTGPVVDLWTGEVEVNPRCAREMHEAHAGTTALVRAEVERLSARRAG